MTPRPSEQRALQALERWAKTNAWARKIAALKTRQLIDGSKR